MTLTREELIERSRIAREITSRPLTSCAGPSVIEQADAEAEAEFLALKACQKTRAALLLGGRLAPRQFPDNVIDLTKHRRCRLPGGPSDAA